MKGITYRNTKTTLPNWDTSLHKKQPIGYAYETPTHFVHFYGSQTDFFVITTGLTVLEEKNGSLKDWVISTFGAEDISILKNEIGHTVQGVWRPSLYFDTEIYQALNVTETEMRLSENGLRLLIQKLDEIFLYIEPSTSSLKTYSHKTRELLILASTEVENFWQYNMRKANVKPLNNRSYTTKDYVALERQLFLKDFAFTLKSYSDIPDILPFQNWDANAPTASLEWYDAYNKTKHDREKYFSEATLHNCIKAVAANLSLHIVRFGPNPMFGNSNSFSTLVNQHFSAKLVNPDTSTFYIPQIEIPVNTIKEIFVLDSWEAGWLNPYIGQSLSI